MLNFDSDSTYCSQAENVPISAPCAAQEEIITFRSLRRSQRLSQQYSKPKGNFSWDKYRNQIAQRSKNTHKRRSLSQSSTQFRNTQEIGVCSQITNVATRSKTAHSQQPQVVTIKHSESLKNMPFQSEDLLADMETQKFSDEMPPNQQQLHNKVSKIMQLSHVPAAPSIDLTESLSNLNAKTADCALDKKDNSNKKSVIDLTKARKQNIRGRPRKIKANEFICDIPPKVRKIDKAEQLKKQTDAELLNNIDLNNIKNENAIISNNFNCYQDNHCTDTKHIENYTPAMPFSNEDNNLSNQHQTKDLKMANKKLISCNKDKAIKNKRNMPSSKVRNKRMSTKQKNDMVTKFVNLADFVEEHDSEWVGKRIEMSETCATRQPNYVPPSPIITKPMPLLRSESNSMLPAVYPPHFIHQKPHFVAKKDIPYANDFIFEMEEETPPKLSHRDGHSSSFNYQPDSPVNKTPVVMLRTLPNTAFSDEFPHSNISTPRTPKSVDHNGTPKGILKHKATAVTHLQPETPKNYLTHDFSQPLEASVTSSPSLPDSLKGIFDSDDLREILNVEKVEYRLCEKHVNALAIVLNLRVEYIREVLKNVLKLDEAVLRKIESVMKTMPVSNDINTRDDAYVRNIMSPVSSFCEEYGQSPSSKQTRSQRQTM